jgi:hypothetical protein
MSAALKLKPLVKALRPVSYVASKTMTQFHDSDAFVRCIMGPIGSGKSVASIMEMMIKSCEQAPAEDGVRRTRWAVIRNTYRELADTTMQSFFDWFPKETGFWRAMDMKFTFLQALPDGTSIEAEFLFRALDKPDDIKKLLSLELTGGWVNEAREAPKAVIDMLIGRLGRYPNKRDGGPTWFGLIMDTNNPDSDHWMYKLFEEDKPENHAVFHQPSGTSPEAENLENLPDGYYINMQSGKDQEWINVYVHGLYGFVQNGKPIYPEYHDDVHHTDEPLIINKDLTVYVGIDFGLTPAALFCQKNAAGRWLIFDELCTFDMGAMSFGRLLKEKVLRDYQGFDIEFYGDPAGEGRAQSDETTPFQMLAANGINAWPAYTNDYTIRRESIAAALMRMDFTGKPGLVIGPKAKLFRKGMAGGYKYKRMQVSGEDKFQDKPDKGRYSHVCEAGQYAFLGAGEGDALIANESWSKSPDYSHSDKLVI